ncbi:SCO family protein [Beijerinckia indica]|uniref:Electron transport protein SCO1/SenC n=1 Tax=Beijerinckia indica subsp. indica (strain ATCC 9039 / DSM 1715 / NCIMB 8712) TaxID=395963 RepID=B2IGW8_BEII9|nr:SCO family protein [Beijerinckia indica]ACB97214.1 electron transport protein SCO1/SenC [Beijerinckia indica subsp. indica ATCC 9039]
MAPLSKSPPPSGLLITAFAVILAVLAATVLLVLPGHDPLGIDSKIRESQPAGPRIGGPFVLEATDGRTISDKDLLGRPYLLFFGYTHCPDFCPTALADMSAVFKAMGEKAPVTGVFITLDPERDTPAVLRDYLSSFDPRIIGLTGEKDKINAVAKAFRVYSRQIPGPNGDYTLDHTGLVYLMDRRGQFINAFNLGQDPRAAAEELKKYF